jgi:PBP1b-binding outer membrane lipoprotein LpoB
MKQYVIITMLVIFLVGCQNSNKTQEKGVITSVNALGK